MNEEAANGGDMAAEQMLVQEFKYEEDNVDKQEDQQARSSECQQIGGSSGGPMMDLSSGG